MSTNDESSIIERAVKGDREAFGMLYEAYVNRIYNYIYYRTGSVHDAEDLTERVFYRALRHIREYNHRGLPFTAWLYRIAHNLVANWHRDNSRRHEVILEESQLKSPAEKNPENELLKAEAKDNMLAVIQKLPPERQELLILKFIEQCSNAEIGIIMGRTEGAVKSLYHRTLLSLREELQEYT